MRKTTKSLVDNEIVIRIIKTMEKRGIRQKELMNSIGIAANAFSKWKYDNNKSYLKHIDGIAKYLNVTTNYLLYGITDELKTKNYSEEDIELFDIIHDLKPERKQLVRLLVTELSSDRN